MTLSLESVAMVVDPDIEGKFQRELTMGERILWTGRPNPSRLFTRSDLFLVPFTLLWAWFSIGFFTQELDRSPADPVTRVIAPLFAVVGLYALVGRFLFLRYRKRRTCYAVTGRRVLVLTETLRRSLLATRIRQIPAIQKTIRSDGSGSLRFGAGNPYAEMWKDTGLEFFGAAYGSPAPTFVDIPDVEEVYRLVTKLEAGDAEGS
jgi:hypothetical protein